MIITKANMFDSTPTHFTFVFSFQIKLNIMNTTPRINEIFMLFVNHSGKANIAPMLIFSGIMVEANIIKTIVMKPKVVAA